MGSSYGEHSTNKAQQPVETKCNVKKLRSNFSSSTSSNRPVVYQSPKIPPRNNPPQSLDHLPQLSNKVKSPLMSPTSSQKFNNSQPSSPLSSSPAPSSPMSVKCKLIYPTNPPQTLNLTKTTAAGDQLLLSPSKVKMVVSSSPVDQNYPPPVVSPRSPSKIPTALPRKTLSNPGSPRTSNSDSSSLVSPISVLSLNSPEKSQSPTSSYSRAIIPLCANNAEEDDDIDVAVCENLVMVKSPTGTATAIVEHCSQVRNVDEH